MKASSTQLRHIEELLARQLRRMGADALIRVLSRLDGGLHFNPQMPCDPDLLEAIRPLMAGNVSPVPTGEPDIAALVLTHRQDAGLTQAKLASLLGVTGGTVCNWERGKSIPVPRHVDTLARVLGIELRDVAAARDRTIYRWAS